MQIIMGNSCELSGNCNEQLFNLSKLNYASKTSPDSSEPQGNDQVKKAKCAQRE
jgi:hypothetical protein